VESGQRTYAGDAVRGFEVLTVPPLLFINVGKFHCLVEAFLAFEATLRPYVARHLPGAKAAVVESPGFKDT
jgi:hypothetical protein